MCIVCVFVNVAKISNAVYVHVYVSACFLATHVVKIDVLCGRNALRKCQLISLQQAASRPRMVHLTYVRLHQ